MDNNTAAEHNHRPGEVKHHLQAVQSMARSDGTFAGRQKNGSTPMVDFIDGSCRFPVNCNICVEIIERRVSGRG